MSISKKDIGAILIFVVLIIAFIFLVNTITTRGDGRELDIVGSLNDNQLRQHGRIPPKYKDSVHRASYHRMGGGTNPNRPEKCPGAPEKGIKNVPKCRKTAI